MKKAKIKFQYTSSLLMVSQSFLGRHLPSFFFLSLLLLDQTLRSKGYVQRHFLKSYSKLCNRDVHTGEQEFV